MNEFTRGYKVTVLWSALAVVFLLVAFLVEHL